MKSNEIKWKASNESKLSELTGHNDSAMEKLRQHIADLEKKIAQEEKTIR